MRIAIVGGGPGGLYFAILLEEADPAHEVVGLRAQRARRHVRLRRRVLRRDARARSRPPTPRRYAEITRRFAHWDDIDIHYRGEVVTSRRPRLLGARAGTKLLDILQQRAAALGVELRFSTEVVRASSTGATWWSPPTASTARCAAATRTRSGRARPRAGAKFMWLGTDLVFDAFTFFFEETEHGVFQVHGYRYSDTMSTFIVETRRRRGAAPASTAPSEDGEHRVLRGAVRRRARRPPPDRATARAGSTS